VTWTGKNQSLSMSGLERYRMMKLRPDDWHTRPRDTLFMTTSCITAVLQVSFSDAFPSKKVRLYSSIFMKEYVTSCFIKEHGQKGFSTRFLLANDHHRCNSDHKVLQGVPILCKTNPCTGPRAPNHPHHMAFCRVGLGPLGALQESC
jgi:hypothetical protein